MTPLLTATDLAALLSLTRGTIYSRDWQRRVGLRPIRIGRSVRFAIEDVRWALENAPVAPDLPRPQRELDALRRWAERRGVPWAHPDAGGDAGAST